MIMSSQLDKYLCSIYSVAGSNPGIGDTKTKKTDIIHALMEVIFYKTCQRWNNK
jgi:hypothetical protein